MKINTITTGLGDMGSIVDIKGYEGKYAVSSKGFVWSYANHMHEGKWIKPINRGEDYMAVNLSRDGKIKLTFIHRIVAEAFIPNPDNLPLVNHINAIPSDNYVENLEWCTSSYNRRHALKIVGFNKTNKFIEAVKRNARIASLSNRRFSNEEIIKLRKEVRDGMAYSWIKKKYNLSLGSISDIVNYRTYKEVL